MRFSDTLRLNAKPDWWEFYVPYDQLKRRVANLKYIHDEIFIKSHSASKSARGEGEESSDDERDIESHGDNVRPLRRTASARVLDEIRADSEKDQQSYGSFKRDPALSFDRLLPLDATESEARASFNRQEKIFFEVLENSLLQVEKFFHKLSNTLTTVTTEIEEEASNLEAQREPDSPSGGVEDSPLLSVTRQNAALTLPEFRRRCHEHYKELGEAMDFSRLNRSAFDKILKKHDKCTGKSTRAAFMQRLDHEAHFTDLRDIQALQETSARVYANAFAQGDIAAAKKELEDHLRDLIVWDRSTIWQDALRTERRVSVFHAIRGGTDIDLGAAASAVVWRPQFIPVCTATLLFFIILAFPQITRALQTNDGPEYSENTLDAAHRCLAITSAVVTLWATEGLPLYVTSFLVVPGTILLQVFVGSDGKPLDAHRASQEVFRHLSSDTLLLIICVYALGAALSKFDIDKVVATAVLSKVRKPHLLLLAVMVLGVVVSMFVSNVAAPVLLNSVMMPTINGMRNTPGSRPFVECLLLGIMASSNIGGFASPISSPQSAVALGLLRGENSISFAKWLLAALPLCAVMVLMFYAALFIIYRPSDYVLPPLVTKAEKFGKPHYIVSGTLVITVVLWACHPLSSAFGSPGVVAVIPILALFGSGILIKEDFNNLPWDVVYLVAGGVVLGAAVKSCKLLDLIAQKFLSILGQGDLRLTYSVFSLFMAIIANFVSHTVSAIVVLPLVFSIGVSLGHPQLMVLAGTFAASSAMALPISSFPNISAIQVEDETGMAYLSTKDILKIGTLMTVLATVVLLSIGYNIMYWLKM
ncbi:Sodium:sulfate symporter transmembrane [Gracilaria domingensis]|nr:Sodium:sulfate symporter transmembrane [Gracilaria domingensis]